MRLRWWMSGLVCAGMMLWSAVAQTAPAPVHWVATWGAAPQPGANKGNFSEMDSTLREIVRVSMGGDTVRIRVSNEIGTEPLHVDGASVAVRAKDGTIDPATSVPLTFAGKAAVVIPPGALIASDRVKFSLAPLSDLAVDLLLPSQPMGLLTQHSEALQTNYMAPGKQLGAKALEGASEYRRWLFLMGVDVVGGVGSGTIVAIGDSITDGHGSTPDTNRRWPNVLAERLQANPETRQLGVVNVGISSNRLLRSRAGDSALMRFDRDVLAQPGIRYLIILEGINDINLRNQPAYPGDTVTRDDLTLILGQMAERAREHGIKVIGATLTPYHGSDEGDVLEQAENDWIRTSGAFDGVIDFAKIVADPKDPRRLLPAYMSDGLHPGDAGYRAMGEAIDLELFIR